LISWAAEFAQRRHDAEILAEMPALLEHWNFPPEYGGDEAQAAQRRAVLAVLDALIQENASVPVSAIAAVAPTFPSQAAILIARLPLSVSRQTLDDWTYGTTGGWGGSTLARVASMILAKDPLPSTVSWNHELMGFVASVVSASEMDVQISIRADNASNDGLGSSTCGDSFGYALPAGWPEVHTYSLDEANVQTSSLYTANNEKANGLIIVDLDGDQIYSQRHIENQGWGSCGNGVEPLDPLTRHRLIAHWLGISEHAMSWQPIEAFTIIWINKDDYERQLGKITESERMKLNGTVESLRQRGFLPESQFVMPRLIMTIQCDMKPCPLQ